MKRTSHYFWTFSNLYGYLCGTRWLAPLHHAFLNLSLHGLGYDNSRFTGEEYFITHELARHDIQVCIDVGANVGAYTTMLIRYLPCTVYAIEPSSSSFTALTQSVSRNPRVTTINAAIGEKNGSGTLFSRHELSEKASLTPTPGDKTPLQETVSIKTLDTLVKEFSIERIDFIKIDTEGYEREVFLGMQDTLRRLQPKFIQFEFNHVHLYRGTTLYDLSLLLEGYAFYRLLPRGWVKIDPRSHTSNVFMFCNIVAKRII